METKTPRLERFQQPPNTRSVSDGRFQGFLEREGLFSCIPLRIPPHLPEAGRGKNVPLYGHTRLQRCFHSFAMRKKKVLPRFPHLFSLAPVPDGEERDDTQEYILMRTWGSNPSPLKRPSQNSALQPSHGFEAVVASTTCKLQLMLVQFPLTLHYE